MQSINIVQLLIIWLVTAVSFVIISKIPTGVEIDDFNKALFSAGVFGILNALVRPLLAVVTVPVLRSSLFRLPVETPAEYDYLRISRLSSRRISVTLGTVECVTRVNCPGIY